MAATTVPIRILPTEELKTLAAGVRRVVGPPFSDSFVKYTQIANVLKQLAREGMLSTDEAIDIATHTGTYSENPKFWVSPSVSMQGALPNNTTIVGVARGIEPLETATALYSASVRTRTFRVIVPEILSQMPQHLRERSDVIAFEVQPPEPETFQRLRDTGQVSYAVRYFTASDPDHARFLMVK